MKRIITLILAALLLAVSAVSCSEAPAEESAPAQGLQSESIAETESSESDEYAHAKSLYNALPEYNFNGGDFIFATQTGIEGSEYELLSDGMKGEGINDAVYLRNEAINERFNCKLQRTDTHVDEAVRTSVTAGDTTLKLAFPSLARVDNLAIEGLLIDLFETENLNLEEPWYDHGSYELQVLGKLYGITSDINYVDDLCTMMILFNKDLMTNHQLGNMYDIVNEGKWTLDILMSMADTVANDLDGNGRYTEHDAYGYITYSYGDTFFYGAGLRWITFDDEGYPQINPDLERVSALLDKTSPFFKGHSWCWAYNNITDIFKTNRALFYSTNASTILTLGDMEYEYGIIPYPKYDETQEKYYSYTFTMAPCVAIPNNGNDTDEISAVMEAMAIQSHMLIKPAVYDQALTRRYSRDEESSAMLDIIFENRIYDFGQFNTSFDGFIGKCILDGTTQFASRYAKKLPVVESEIQAYIDALLGN